jgi:hypothetical protein
MILPDFYHPSRANYTPTNEFGIDSLIFQDKKDHYLNFPYPITYQFNNRGFRDADWPLTPAELQDAIWCFGDSFTVGVGSMYEHIWPQVLQKNTGRRTINVSMDGASNQWIARKVDKVCREIIPSVIVIMWSYFQRRELPDHTKSDENRRDYGGRTSDIEDYYDFMSCVKQVNQYKESPTQIMHFTIPDAQSCSDLQLSWDNFKGPSWPDICPKNTQEFNLLPAFIKDEIINLFDQDRYLQSLLEKNDMFAEYKISEQIIEVPRLDLARDAHHFNVKTSEWVSTQILSKIVP